MVLAKAELGTRFVKLPLKFRSAPFRDVATRNRGLEGAFDHGTFSHCRKDGLKCLCDDLSPLCGLAPHPFDSIAKLRESIVNAPCELLLDLGGGGAPLSLEPVAF